MTKEIFFIDPLGHKIYVPERFGAGCGKLSLEGIGQVIHDPRFMIRVTRDWIYFIRLLQLDLIVLIEARVQSNYYVVDKCQENPSPSDIVLLLDRGGTIFFM